jgi:hypothetical protein
MEDMPPSLKRQPALLQDGQNLGLSIGHLAANPGEFMTFRETVGFGHLGLCVASRKNFRKFDAESVAFQSPESPRSGALWVNIRHESVYAEGVKPE